LNAGNYESVASITNQSFSFVPFFFFIPLKEPVGKDLPHTPLHIYIPESYK
jgi:hypothetical protein